MIYYENILIAYTKHQQAMHICRKGIQKRDAFSVSATFNGNFLPHLLSSLLQYQRQRSACFVSSRRSVWQTAWQMRPNKSERSR